MLRRLAIFGRRVMSRVSHLVHLIRLTLLFGLLLPATAGGAALPENPGCRALEAISAPICIARVKCNDSLKARERVVRLFERCQAGEDITPEELNTAIRLFGNETGFRCCVGNELHRAFFQQGMNGNSPSK